MTSLQCIFSTVIIIILIYLHAISSQSVYFDHPSPFCEFDNLFFITKTSRFVTVDTSYIRSKSHKCFPVETLPNTKETYPKRGFGLDAVSNSLSKSNIIQYNAVVTIPYAIFIFETMLTKNLTNDFNTMFEHNLGIWSLFGQNCRNDVELIVLGGVGEMDNWSIDPQILSLLSIEYPNAFILTWKRFHDKYKEKQLKFDHVFISDRQMYYNDPTSLHYNSFYGSAKDMIKPAFVEHFGKYLLREHAIPITPLSSRNTIQLTYISIQPRLHHEFPVYSSIQNMLIEKIKLFPEVNLKIISFSDLTFKQHMNIVANTDIFIGAHITAVDRIYTMFAPSHCLYIELFPMYNQNFQNRIMSEMRGLEHISVIPKVGPVNHEQAYLIGVTTEANIGTVGHGEELDVGLVASIIRVRASELLSEIKVARGWRPVEAVV